MSASLSGNHCDLSVTLHTIALDDIALRTNVGTESFSLRVTRLWNNLPEVVVIAPSGNSFKTRLDRHWSTDEFLYNCKAALPGSRRAFHGKVEDLTTEATAYGQEEPK